MSTSYVAAMNVAAAPRPILPWRKTLPTLIAAGAAGALAVGLVSAPETTATVPALAGAAAAASGPNLPMNTTAASGLSGLLGLPLAMQFRVNGDLGAGDIPFHVVGTSKGLTASSPTYAFETRFAPAGPVMSAGQDVLSLSLTGIGYGSALAAPSPAIPVRAAKPNAVQYQRGNLTERYEHGPLGLAQSFTLATRPASGGTGELSLATKVGGGLRPAISSDGRNAVFTRDGQTVYGYRGLTALDATNKALPAHLSSSGTSLLINVDDTNAAYPITIDPMVWKGVLTGAAGGAYGYSVAAENYVDAGDFQNATYYAVGAPYEGLASGRVYHYDIRYQSVGPHLIVPYSSTSPVPQTGAGFGWSVNLAPGWDDVDDGYHSSTHLIAVGAPYQDVAATDDGAAFVLRAGNGTAAPFSQGIARLKASDGAAGDGLGKSVKVGKVGDSWVAAAGAPNDDSYPFADTGSVRVFPIEDWSGLSWANEQTALLNTGLQSYDLAGTSLDLADNGNIVVGNPGDDGAFVDQGSATVFLAPATGWANGSAVQGSAVKLTHAAPATQDKAGHSVAISANDGLIAVGVPEDDWGNRFGVGSIRVFAKPGGGWAAVSAETSTLRELSATAATGDLTGSSVSVNPGGTYVAAGAPGAEATVNDQGLVFAFVKPAGGWMAETYPHQVLASNSPFVGLNFGKSLAVVDNRVIVGSVNISAPLAHDGKAEHFIQN